MATTPHSSPLALAHGAASSSSSSLSSLSPRPTNPNRSPPAVAPVVRSVVWGKKGTRRRLSVKGKPALAAALPDRSSSSSAAEAAMEAAAKAVAEWRRKVKYMGTRNKLLKVFQEELRTLMERLEACRGSKEESDGCLVAWQTWWEAHEAMVEFMGTLDHSGDPLLHFCEDHPESEDCQTEESVVFEPIKTSIRSLPKEKREALAARLVENVRDVIVAARGEFRFTDTAREMSDGERVIRETIVRRSKEVSDACHGDVSDDGCMAALEAEHKAWKDLSDLRRKIEENADHIEDFCRERPESQLCQV